MKRQQRFIPERLSESIALSGSYGGDWLHIGDLPWLFFTAFTGTVLQMLSQSPGRVREAVTLHKSLDLDTSFHRERGLILLL